MQDLTPMPPQCRREPFPPARPRSRRRWFNELVQVSARLRAVRTLGQQAPRMVNRRHSPYASHDRQAPKRRPMQVTPVLLTPMAGAAPAGKRSVARWAGVKLESD